MSRCAGRDCSFLTKPAVCCRSIEARSLSSWTRSDSTSPTAEGAHPAMPLAPPATRHRLGSEGSRVPNHACICCNLRQSDSSRQEAGGPISASGRAPGRRLPPASHARARQNDIGARSAVGERPLHTREDAGSKPAAPIKRLLLAGAFRAAQRSSWTVVEDRERESLPAALAGPRRREARPVHRLTRERSPVCPAAPIDA
jgi:hypothetical protein